jgi:hypothetical protein
MSAVSLETNTRICVQHVQLTPFVSGMKPQSQRISAILNTEAHWKNIWFSPIGKSYAYSIAVLQDFDYFRAFGNLAVTSSHIKPPA